MPLPSNLHECKLWAERLRTGELHLRKEFEARASDMDEATIGELGSFYERVAVPDHIDNLNGWLTGNGGRVPMDLDERAIRNLIILFSHLGRRGWKPFDTQRLKHDNLVPPTPDWSKLPSEFHFLAAPAEQTEKWTYVFSDAGREQVANAMKPDERALLEKVADQVRQVGYKRVSSWRQSLGVQEHIEARMVFNLLGVLDALGLKYY